MKPLQKKRTALKRRRLSGRRKISGTAERPRLVVYRSLHHIYAQVIDDSVGRTLATASTLTAAVSTGLKSTGNIDAAKAVGRQVATAAIAGGVRQVCFDRGGRKYHGRVKALADAAREAGLAF